MKKRILTIMTFILVFAVAAKAQQTEMKVEAVLKPDGGREMRITDASGKLTVLTAGDEASIRAKYLSVVQKKPEAAAPAANGKPVFVSHEAVIGKNGDQEMHLTDASGKVTIITAARGESLQEKYWAFLKKEGIPCACGSSGTVTAADQAATKTAVKDADQSPEVSDGTGFVVSAKVCLEGGGIKKGDLLVASSRAGVAMKADISKIKSGQVIGRALQDYNSNTVGEINVLINIK